MNERTGGRHNRAMVTILDPRSITDVDGADRTPGTDDVGSVELVRPASERVELIGTHLRAEGSVELGSFRRLSDYVNLLNGFFTIHDVTLMSRLGEPTRLAFDDLRVRLDEIGLVAQKTPQRYEPGDDVLVPKSRRRLVLMTTAHLIYGYAYLHSEASLTAFVDATDPPFVPMTNVRLRWLADRRVAGRYPFALVHRSQIISVATDVPADGSPAEAAVAGLSWGRAADLGW